MKRVQGAANKKEKNLRHAFIDIHELSNGTNKKFSMLTTVFLLLLLQL